MHSGYVCTSKNHLSNNLLNTLINMKKFNEILIVDFMLDCTVKETLIFQFRKHLDYIYIIIKLLKVYF